MAGQTRAATKSRPKKAVKKTAKKRVRTLSAGHKKALAEGRTLSATIDHYLSVINTPKRRGRKVSSHDLEVRLARAITKKKTASGVDKVLAAQEARDLQKRLAEMKTTSGATDLKSLEAAFIKAGKRFSENRGISYGAWRDAGVPAKVLTKAGVARTRG